MKGRFSGQTEFQGGFSTLEILIAMAVLIFVLSSVVTVSFGGQAILSDSEIAGSALASAQELIEAEQSLARKDFRLVNPVPETIDGIYRKRVEVETESDYLTKKVTTIVAWTGEYGRNLDIRLTTLVTNFENAVGGDTCNSIVTGQNWLAPTVSTYAMSALNGIAGNFPVSDIDVAGGMMYVSVNDSSLNTNPTFFVFDASTNPPTYKGSIDNDKPTSRREDGLNAIHAAGNYAYAASAISANFNTCSQSENCAQLQIFNVSNPVSPILAKSFKLPNSLGSGGLAVGKSIFYKDGYVYVGLTSTASGPEFNIVDVHDPLNPKWIGGWGVGGHDVNAIYVKGKYTYVLTAASQELYILDISNPASPVVAGGFDAPFTFGNGKSVYAVGDTLYFGRTFSSEPEFYVLDNEDPTIVNPTDILGTVEAGSTQSVNGIFIRDFFAFILSNDQFRIFDISNPSSMSLKFDLPLSEKSKTLECDGNILYIGSGETEGNIGTITLLKPGS